MTIEQVKLLIQHVFSHDQIKQLKACKTHKELAIMTTELLPQINKKTGQENDARYWAYLCELALVK